MKNLLVCCLAIVISGALSGAAHARQWHGGSGWGGGPPPNYFGAHPYSGGGYGYFYYGGFYGYPYYGYYGGGFEGCFRRLRVVGYTQHGHSIKRRVRVCY